MLWRSWNTFVTTRLVANSFIDRCRCTMRSEMKPHPEMIEGPEAFDKFKDAMKAILTVPKSALPPSPFKKWKPKKRKTARKAN